MDTDQITVVGYKPKRRPNPLHSKPFTYFKKIIIWADGEQYSTKIDWVTLEEVPVCNKAGNRCAYHNGIPYWSEQSAVTYLLQDGSQGTFYADMDFIEYLCYTRPEVEDHRKQS
jgi:hypothetical protein